MDGPVDPYHSQLSSIKSYKAKRDFNNVSKFIDHCKEKKTHQYSLEEKELRRNLDQLQREKRNHKRRGSCLGPEESQHGLNSPQSSSHHHTRSKHSVHGDTRFKHSGHKLKSNNSLSTAEDSKCKEKKRLIVKLQPGKIDPDCTSPPSAHDVAVRMLFDKKAGGQNGKKRKGSKKKSSDYLLDTGAPEKSKSHKEATLRLPNIQKKARRKSIANADIKVTSPDSKDRVHGTKLASNTSSISKMSPDQIATNKHIYEVVKICMNPDIVILSSEEQQSIQQNASSDTGTTNQAQHEILRKKMMTPTPDKWQGKPPVVPSKAWENSESFEKELFAEIERVAQANKAKLPHIVHKPGSRPSLVDSINHRQLKEDKHVLGPPPSPQQRRASMDYDRMEFLDRKHSIIPSHQKRRSSLMTDHGRHNSISSQDSHGSFHQRRASIATDSPSGGRRGSVRIDSPSGSRRGSMGMDSRTGSRLGNLAIDSSILENLDKRVDSDVIEHYYNILSDNQKLLFEDNPDFEIPDNQKHIPLCTLKRSQRRKTLALETLLKSLPSYKHTAEMDPKEMLDCRYLRLTKNNIEELEDACKYEGQDPGIHAHMNTQEVEDYFDQIDSSLDRSENISEIELAA